MKSPGFWLNEQAVGGRSLVLSLVVSERPNNVEVLLCKVKLALAIALPCHLPPILCCVLHQTSKCSALESCVEEADWNINWTPGELDHFDFDLSSPLPTLVHAVTE